MLAQRTNSHTAGNPDSPLKPVSLALAYGASFVARGFAGDVAGMKEIFKQAIGHNGFSFVHLLTPCVTFDKVNTLDVMRENVNEVHDSHDTGSHEAAVRLAEDDRMYYGVFYHDKERPSYRENLRTLWEGNSSAG